MNEHHPDTSSISTIAPSPITQHPSYTHPVVDRRLNALIYGFMGLILTPLGVIFGALSLSQTSKISTHDTSALKVLGVIALVFSILFWIVMICYGVVLGLLIQASA